MPEGEPVPEIVLPPKGTSMADVERKYGEPRAKRGTVGGDTPRQPPITRWDYDSFVVVFERDKVVDAVIPGAPPRIQNRVGLERVALPPPTAAPASPPSEPIPSEPMPPPAPPAEPMSGLAPAPVAESPAEAPPPPQEPPAEKLSPEARETPVPPQ